MIRRLISHALAIPYEWIRTRAERDALAIALRRTRAAVEAMHAQGLISDDAAAALNEALEAEE